MSKETTNQPMSLNPANRYVELYRADACDNLLEYLIQDCDDELMKIWKKPEDFTKEETAKVFLLKSFRTNLCRIQKKYKENVRDWFMSEEEKHKVRMYLNDYGKQMGSEI